MVIGRGFGILAFTVLTGLAVPAATADGTNSDESRPTASAPVAVRQVSLPATGIRDEAAMVLIGTALIGLAAAVRRTT